MINGKFHETVMAQEAISYLDVKEGEKYIDATAGTGGHILEIVKAGGSVLGLDADPEMIAIAEHRLNDDAQTATLVVENFRNIDKVAEANGFIGVSGVIFDLGVSNIHLTGSERGFSFQNPEAPLDMRLNSETQGVAGRDLVNVLREDQLVDMFLETMSYGEARLLAKNVVRSREQKPIVTVGDFLEVCSGIRGKEGINPATLPFLALRIAVNSELENLEEALPKAFGLLTRGGRLVVISFHSGEDRIVKEFFKLTGESAKILTESPVGPSDKEIAGNPRSRSAKMRVLQKI